MALFYSARRSLGLAPARCGPTVGRQAAVER